MNSLRAPTARLGGCGFWTFLTAGGLCLVSKFVDFSPGPRASLVNILLDHLPATGLYLLHIRWPLVREGGDAGVLTVLGVIVFYGAPAYGFYRLRGRPEKPKDKGLASEE